MKAASSLWNYNTCFKGDQKLMNMHKCSWRCGDGFGQSLDRAREDISHGYKRLRLLYVPPYMCNIHAMSPKVRRSCVSSEEAIMRHAQGPSTHWQSDQEA